MQSCHSGLFSKMDSSGGRDAIPRNVGTEGFVVTEFVSSSL